MTPLPTGPETVATFTLDVDASKIIAEVLRLADGTVRVRLSHGEGVGDVLTLANVCALRLMLTRVIEAMATAEGRAA